MHRKADFESIVTPQDKIENGQVFRAMLNAGFHYKLDDAVVPFMDDRGQSYRGLLDSDGTPLPPNKKPIFLLFNMGPAK